MTEITGPLSFATLEKAYLSIVYGWNEPDLIRCSAHIRRRLGEIATPGFDPYKPLRFNGAAIESDFTIPDDQIIVTYSDSKIIKSLATNAGAKSKGEYDRYTKAIIHIEGTQE